MDCRTVWAGILAWGAISTATAAQPGGPAPTTPTPAGPARAETLARMPVREITVFKDGHAFVLHAGKLPVGADGQVQLDTLPVPILGAYWPYSADRAVRLHSVTASPRKVVRERPALSVWELLEANPGAQVQIVQTDRKTYSAQVIEIPRRETPEPGETNVLPELQGGGFGGSPAAVQTRGDTVLLKTADGVSAVPLRMIQSVTFKGPYRRTLAEEQTRNLLTLKLEWPGGRAAQNADVGMFYLQKGIRWVPSYKVAIDGAGQAVVKLQATLVNELTDLEDVTANLVIGVPNFYFKDTPDPISLQQTFPALSRYFQPESQTGFAFSNAIMSQGGLGGFGGGAPARRCGEPAPEDTPCGEGGAAVPLDAVAGDRSEDLFVFTLPHLTLKKGQNMVVPVAEYPVKYRDVYTVDVAFAPPKELEQNLNPQQQEELIRLLRAPRAQHKIRLLNGSNQPFTTAPVLLVKDDRVIAQSLMPYTAPGVETDLTLTTAPDIRVKKKEGELKRTPDAVTFNGLRYWRVDAEGTVTLTNQGQKAVELEINRYIAGLVDRATQDGKIEQFNPLDDDSDDTPALLPNWWRNYSWPGYWAGLNGRGRVLWKITLQPGESKELGYAWHYFWRE